MTQSATPGTPAGAMFTDAAPVLSGPPTTTSVSLPGFDIQNTEKVALSIALPYIHAVLDPILNNRAAMIAYLSQQNQSIVDVVVTTLEAGVDTSLKGLFGPIRGMLDAALKSNEPAFVQLAANAEGKLVDLATSLIKAQLARLDYFAST